MRLETFIYIDYKWVMFASSSMYTRMEYQNTWHWQELLFLLFF